MGSILESHSSCHSVTPTAVLTSARVISSDVVSLMVQELDLGLRQPAGGLTVKRHSSTLSWHHWEFWLRDSTYKNEHYARIYIPEAHWAMWQPVLNKIGKFDIQWKTAFHSYGGNWKNCFHPHGMKLITNCLNAPHPRSCKSGCKSWYHHIALGVKLLAAFFSSRTNWEQKNGLNTGATPESLYRNYNLWCIV